MHPHGIWPEAVGTKVAIAESILRVLRDSYSNKIPWHAGVENDETPNIYFGVRRRFSSVCPYPTRKNSASSVHG